MQTGSWLQLRLRSRAPGSESMGFADGALAIVRSGGSELRRTVGGASYLSQSSRLLHFGLGDAEVVDEVVGVGRDGELAEPPPAGLRRARG